MTAYKSVGHFRNKTSGRIIRSKIVYLESVAFQLHAHMLSSKVAQSFFRLRGLDLSHRHVCFFWVEQIHQSMASERTTRQSKCVLQAARLHRIHAGTHTWGDD